MLPGKQRTCKQLEADDDDGNDEHSSSVKCENTDKKVKSFRKKNENQEDEDNEGAVNLKEERRVKQKVSCDEADDSDFEEERLLDQKEREELERHLREKDAARTTKLTEQKLSRREEEVATRRAHVVADDDIGALRKVSRQEYLKKREQKKLEEMRDDIEDEQYLFEDVKLIEAKERELRSKKQIYELVKNRSEEDDNINEYRIPDAYDEEGGVNQEKRFSVAMEHYRDTKDGDKIKPFAEQEAWEDHQIGKATLKYGSKNKKLSEDYDLMFEDQIEFIQGQIMGGENVDDEAYHKEQEKSTAKSAHEKLLV